MLKHFGYDGVYLDQNIAVSALLENPLDYGFDADTLTFSVTIRGKGAHAASLRMEDFSFYLMDEQNQLYNMQKISDLQPNVAPVKDDEPVRSPDGLILTDFKHKFLFQDLRIAFHYKNYRQLNIIMLSH